MADEPQRIILKQLHIPVESEPEKVLAAAEAIRHFLNTLSANKFSRFEITPPLGLSYGPTDFIVNNQNREFGVKYEEREPSQDQQRDTFYGSDLVSALLNVSAWIDNSIRSKKLQVQLTGQNNNLQAFRSELPDLLQDEAKTITTYRLRLESVVELLLKTLDQVFFPQVSADQFASLQPLITALNQQPPLVHLLWLSNVSPLFQTFKTTDPQTAPRNIAAVEIPLLDPTQGKYPKVSEVRETLNSFVKGMEEFGKRIVSQKDGANLIPEQTLNKIKEHLYQSLLDRYVHFYEGQTFVSEPNSDNYRQYITNPTTNEYYRRLNQYAVDSLFEAETLTELQNISSQLHYSEDLISEDKFNLSDVNTNAKFESFFVGSNLMNKLVTGNDVVYPPVTISFGITTSEGGGADETPTQTPTQLLTLQEVVSAILETATNQLYQQTGLEQTLKSNNLIIDKKLAESLVHAELKAFIQQLPLDLENTIKKLTYTTNTVQHHYYDAETNRVLVSNEFRTWENDFIDQLVNTVLNSLSIDNQNLIDRAIQNLQVLQEGPIEERVSGTSALVPDQLVTLLTKEGINNLPPNNEFNQNWWQGLSAAEKRSTALAVLGQHTTSTAELIRLQTVLLISYRATYPTLFGDLTVDQLPPNIRALFADQVTQYLETLSFEDFQRIVANPGSARYFLLRQITAKLNTNPTFQAQLQSTLQTLIETKPLKAPETQSAEETQQQIQKQASQEHLAEYLANPDSEEAIQELLKRYDKASVQEFLTSTYGTGETAKEKRYSVLTTPYGPEKSYKELKKLQDEEQDVYWKKRLAAEQFWRSLTSEEKDHLYQTEFAGTEIPTLIFQKFGREVSKIDYSQVPLNFSFVNAISTLQQGENEKKIKSSLNPFKRFKRRLSPAKRASDAIKSSILERSASFLSNLAIPGLGGVVSGMLALIPNKRVRNAIAGGISAAIAGFIANTIRLFVSTAGGFIGGLVGGGIGGFLGTVSGIPFGIGGGAFSGWTIGTNIGSAILPDNILGFHGLTKGISFGGTPTSAATLTTQVGTGVSATPTPYLTTPTGVFIATTGAVTLTAVTFNIIQQGAFLMPTIGDDGLGASQYVTIEKVAEPGIKMTTAQDITYTITIKADKGYSIVVNQMSDSMTISYNQEKNKKESEARSHDTTFFKDESGNPVSFPFTIEEGDLITLQPYTESFNQTDHHDANVVNTFKLFFAVPEENIDETAMSQNPNNEDGLPMSQIPDPNASPENTPMSEIRTATTGESVCFGECPQTQEGCWPVSGIVMQGPFCNPKAPTYDCTHSYVAAIDFAAKRGTPVYSTMQGTATFYPAGTGIACAGGILCYGNHVVVKSGNTELMYAHLNDLYLIDGQTTEKTAVNNQTSLSVKPGDQIGEVGMSGLALLGSKYVEGDNNHLHWELRPSTLDMSQYVPGNLIQLGSVRSCYENQ